VRIFLVGVFDYDWTNVPPGVPHLAVAKLLRVIELFGESLKFDGVVQCGFEIIVAIL
jgi:hypothetical protein